MIPIFSGKYMDNTELHIGLGDLAISINKCIFNKSLHQFCYLMDEGLVLKYARFLTNPLRYSLIQLSADSKICSQNNNAPDKVHHSTNKKKAKQNKIE